MASLTINSPTSDLKSGVQTAPLVSAREKSVHEQTTTYKLIDFLHDSEGVQDSQGNIAVRGYDWLIEDVSRELSCGNSVVIDCGINPLCIGRYAFTRSAMRVNADMLLRGAILDQIAEKCGFALQTREETRKVYDHGFLYIPRTHLFVIIEPK